MPKTVRIAIQLIWLSLAVSMLLSIIQWFLHTITLNDLITALAVNALLCLIPYKLAQQSHIARLLFTALFGLSLFFLLAAGREIEVTLLDKVDLLISVPLNIYSIYFLFFNAPAHEWFARNR